MKRRLRLPGESLECIERRCRRIGVVFFVVVVAALCLISRAKAQDNYVPIYAASVGRAILKDCTPAQRAKLILGANPNSGPHNKRLADSAAVIDQARRDKVRFTFYIDGMAGVKYSPLIVRTDKGWQIVQLKKPRVKTPAEIRTERDAYVAMYGGEPWGWFLDDIKPGMTAMLSEVATWKGTIILNPGTHFQPPAFLPAAWVVIHEDEDPWKPTMLTAWEQANLKRCVVMQLNQSRTSLPAFADVTKKLAARYASELSDKGGAYNNKPLLLP